jgi:hypothetical protein
MTEVLSISDPSILIGYMTPVCLTGCREKQVVVLRPLSFLQHSTDFILHVQQQSEPTAKKKKRLFTGRTSDTCWAVPHHLQSVPWTKLLRSSDLTDQLMIGYSPVVDVLSKIEERQFIHKYISSASSGGAATVVYELPRFNLRFDLQEGHLVSHNFRGYQLATNQQLADEQWCTLPNFQQYLVLQRSSQAPGNTTTNMGQQRSGTLVLIPAGDICVERSLMAGSNALVKINTSR